MNLPKLLITAPILRFNSILDLLNKKFDVSVKEYLEYSQMENIISNYEALIPNARIKIDKQIIDKASSLKAIYQPSVGVDHIDLNCLKQNNIKFDAIGFDNDFLGNQWTTAEHTILLILGCLKNIKSTVNDLDNFQWDNRKYTIQDLKNLTVGIIGFGNIGRKVSELLRPFNCKISVYDPYIPLSSITCHNAVSSSLNSLLESSDIISLHVPLNKETTNMIGPKEINKMKSSAYLINAARGGIVDEEAFIKAVESHKLRGGAFDVLLDENPDGVENSKLANFAKSKKNILITPHVGGSSYQYMQSVFMKAAIRIEEMFCEKD